MLYITIANPSYSQVHPMRYLLFMMPKGFQFMEILIGCLLYTDSDEEKSAKGIQTRHIHACNQ